MESVNKEVGVRGVFSSEGASWKRQRKLTAPAFTNHKVKGHYDFISTSCERLRNKWTTLIQKQTKPEEGIVIDVLSEMMNFTLDIISLIAFGYDLNSIEKHSEEAECLLSVMPFIFKRATAVFPYWKLFHTATDKAYYKSVPKLETLVKGIIEKHQNDSTDESSKKNFIEVILQARQDGEDHLTDDEIIGNVITFLLAGQDTTANTLAWSLYYLSRNHQIQTLVFEEVSNAIIDPSKSKNDWYLPDRNQVDSLNFTQNVVKEVLRIRPPTPVLGLSPVDSPQVIQVGDRKTVVNVNDTVVLLNRKVATKKYGMNFDLHRWETMDENEQELLKMIANVPFGGGPRICPGKHLSLYESTLFLSMMANNFIVRPAESTTSEEDESLAFTESPGVKERMEMTMGPENLHLRIFLRNN